jgi:hypothetical protein
MAIDDFVLQRLGRADAVDPIDKAANALGHLVPTEKRSKKYY